jgi:hypothetical protein
VKWRALLLMPWNVLLPQVAPGPANVPSHFRNIGLAGLLKINRYLAIADPSSSIRAMLTSKIKNATVPRVLAKLSRFSTNAAAHRRAATAAKANVDLMVSPNHALMKMQLAMIAPTATSTSVLTVTPDLNVRY